MVATTTRPQNPREISACPVDHAVISIQGSVDQKNNTPLPLSPLGLRRKSEQFTALSACIPYIPQGISVFLFSAFRQLGTEGAGYSAKNKKEEPRWAPLSCSAIQDVFPPFRNERERAETCGDQCRWNSTSTMI
jgi:hypothetical protein